jgi:hypothetical protein
MSGRKIDFSDSEILDPVDLDAVASLPLALEEMFARDLSGYPQHWSGFTVSTTATPTEVLISEGAYWDSKDIFKVRSPLTESLLQYQPLNANDEVWVALILRGQTDTTNADREFETSNDVDVSVPVVTSTPKYIDKNATIVIQTGPTGPAPQPKPTIAENDANIAFVRLTSSGVDGSNIIPDLTRRVTTVYELDLLAKELSATTTSLTEKTQTIQSDLAHLAGRFDDIPSWEVLEFMQRGISQNTISARGAEEGDAPYFYDPCLVDAGFDILHADWLGDISEGIRFPTEAEAFANMNVLNSDDDLISLVDNFLMPAYVEEPRIVNDVDGTDDVSLSDQVHTVITAEKKTVSRKKETYGKTFKVCVNRTEWGLNDKENQVGKSLKHAGETFKVVAQETKPVTYKSGKTWDSTFVYMKKKQTQVYTRTYWEYKTETYGINGSVRSQSFLNEKEQVLTSIDIYLSKVGSSGNIHMLIVGVPENGAPTFNDIIATSEVAHADLAVGWINFAFDPTLLEAGRRYAFVPVTTGNHNALMTGGNKFAGGTSFTTTDGAFQQGDLLKDFVFRINCARYPNVRTVVEFEPLTLTGGMTDIEFLMTAWETSQARVVWEYQKTGTSTWFTLDDDPDTALSGLPALCRLRAVFIGTQEVQAMMKVGAESRSRCFRRGSTLQMVPQERALDISSDNIRAVYEIDGYDPAVHTVTPKLHHSGGTIVAAADAVTIEIDPYDNERAKVRATFMLGSAVTDAAPRLDVSTSNKTVPFHVQNFSLHAL